jgi:hypothetical protein
MTLPLIQATTEFGYWRAFADDTVIVRLVCTSDLCLFLLHAGFPFYEEGVQPHAQVQVKNEGDSAISPLHWPLHTCLCDIVVGGASLHICIFKDQMWSDVARES